MQPFQFVLCKTKDELKSAANVVCSKKRKGDQDIQNECYSTDAPAKKKPLMIPSSQVINFLDYSFNTMKIVNPELALLKV